MTDYTPQLLCDYCLQPAQALDWRCTKCGGPLSITNLPRFDTARIREGDWSLWRYEAMLPVSHHFSLGEGATPLVKVDWPGRGFLAKLEYLNPTGSYKDRGTVTLVNHLLHQGVTEVVEDSSGNAGASLAMYAGATGIHARIFVPASAPEGKKRLIALNAELVEVPGPRSAPTEACHQAARETVYASHAWSPFFAVGQMTAAWEVWEQLGRRAPDAILCPVGHGGLFLGFARGFKALLDAGLIERMPALIAVQSAACDPVVRAWENGQDEPEPAAQNATVADGIVVSLPSRGREILAAIRATGGAALRVDDAEILQAREMLTKRGLLVEPTSAVPIAALERLQADTNAAIVVALTGSGLKSLGAH
jgi:threonine synthase